MPFIGNKPSSVPLTSADIADGIITSAKIVDGTITNSDVASSIITGQTAETSIAGGDSILIYDDSATALRKMTRTNFVSGLGGLAEVDMWRITANTTATTSSFLTANWERIDVSPEGTSGTGMTESSGVFTFPSTGYWFVSFQLHGFANSGPALFIGPEIHGTTNNSTYVQLTYANAGNWDTAAEDTIYTSTILNISDTANRKVKFGYYQGISENRIRGNTSYTATGATFIKLI